MAKESGNKLCKHIRTVSSDFSETSYGSCGVRTISAPHGKFVRAMTVATAAQSTALQHEIPAAASARQIYGDFCCLEAKLVVEIDGACPLTEQGQRHDAIRDHWMVEEGYRVLRFTGKQVEFETRAVCDAIDAALRSTRSQ